MSKEVILTGLRSNSEFHIGNYLGAIQPMVELQKNHAEEYQVNMFVPDLHSFTTPIDHGKLYDQTIQNLKLFVAAGLDINNPDTYIYRQSYITAHSELTWILNCFTSFGELNRMTQFKDKRATLPELSNVLPHQNPEAFNDLNTKDINRLEHDLERSVSAGLLIYPVLMAADILLYGAKWVPVGDDQKQHVEFTRDLALRINSKFGEIFVVPEDNSKQLEFSGRQIPVRVRSLRNPVKKMSKSVEDPAGTIMLSDNPDDAAKKIMSAATDSVGSIHFDFDKQPGVSNLLQILALLTNRPQNEVNSEWEGKNSYGELKTVVADAVKSFLSDLQSKTGSVNHDELMNKLAQDEEAMKKVADETLLKVQKAIGLRPV